MRKFTLTIIAALVAVVAFGQAKVQESRMNSVSVEPIIEVHHVAKNLSSVENMFSHKKASRKAISSVADLAGDVIIINAEYNYDEEADDLVEAVPAQLAINGKIEVLDASANKIAIYGIDFNAAASGTYIEGTVDLKAKTITIPDKQVIWNHKSYGNFVMKNALADEAFTATISDGGAIVINGVWYEQFGDLLSSYRNGSFKVSAAVASNGTMEYINSKAQKVTANVFIEQDDQDVCVYNFGDFGIVGYLTLSEDHTFTADDSELVYSESVDENTIAYFGIYGLTEDGEELIESKGTGTETTLVADNDWTLCDATNGYWFGQQKPYTITLTDGTEFDYTSTGINAIANQPAVSESYVDLTGRKVSADAKGLVIKTVTYADGTKKSVKVIRK